MGYIISPSQTISGEKKPCEAGSPKDHVKTTSVFDFRAILASHYKMSIVVDEFFRESFSCSGVRKFIFRQSRVKNVQIPPPPLPHLGAHHDGLNLANLNAERKFSRFLSVQCWHV